MAWSNHNLLEMGNTHSSGLYNAEFLVRFDSELQKARFFLSKEKILFQHDYTRITLSLSNELLPHPPFFPNFYPSRFVNNLKKVTPGQKFEAYLGAWNGNLELGNFWTWVQIIYRINIFKMYLCKQAWRKIKTLKFITVLVTSKKPKVMVRAEKPLYPQAKIIFVIK